MTSPIIKRTTGREQVPTYTENEIEKTSFIATWER